MDIQFKQKITLCPLALTWYTISAVPISSRCCGSISISIRVRIGQTVCLRVAFIKFPFKDAKQAGDPVVQSDIQDKLQEKKKQLQWQYYFLFRFVSF